MSQYILRRIALMLPTLFLVTILVFGMIRLLPGDALTVLLGETLVNQPLAELEKMKEQLGFDKPLYQQYFIFISNAAQGDLGTSLLDKKPVTDKILSRLPVSIELSLLAIMVSLCIAIPVGVISAIRQDTPIDYLLRSAAIGALSVPSFWLATLAILLPAIFFQQTLSLRYVPFTVNPVENLKQFIVPALILGTVLSGTVMRITRTMMLEVLRQDYIRTAWAKGLREQVVIYRHALKNALIPVVTVLGLQIAFLIGGTVIQESVFGLPGMGLLLIEAIQHRDFPVIQGINLFVATWVIIINLLVDVSYAFLDPRIRYN